MLLDKKNGKFKRWENFYRKCYLNMSKLHRAMLNVGNREFRNEKELQLFLKKHGLKSALGTKERERIFNVYTAIQKRKKDREIVKDFIRYDQERIDNANSNAFFIKNQEMLRKSRDLHSTFIRDIIELSIASKIKNKGWVKRVASKIIKQGPREFIFRSQQYSYLDNKSMMEFQKIVYKLLDSVKPLVNTEMLHRILVNRINKVLKSRSSSDSWSLADIREIIKWNALGIKFFGFWFQEMLSRTSDMEATLILQRIVDRNYIQKMRPAELWVFIYYYPKEKALRKLIIEKIYKAYLLDDPYIKYLILKLLERETIKKELGKKEAFFKKALFQIKRNFYRKLLLKGQAVHFSLYNLMRLGDNNPKNLWWFAF